VGLCWGMTTIVVSAVSAARGRPLVDAQLPG